MRRFPFLVLMIVAIAAAITVLIPSTQEAKNGRHAAQKIAAPLRRAANYDRSDLERIRVIVKATDGIQPGQIYAKLQSAGAMSQPESSKALPEATLTAPIPFPPTLDETAPDLHSELAH